MRCAFISTETCPLHTCSIHHHHHQQPPTEAAETSHVVETRANVSCCSLGSCVTPQCAAGDRSQPPRPEREKSARSTKPCGDRRDFPRGRGQHGCWRCTRRLGFGLVPQMTEQLVDSSSRWVWLRGGLEGPRPGQGLTVQVELISPAPAVFPAPAPVFEHFHPHQRYFPCQSQWWSILHPRQR